MCPMIFPEPDVRGRREALAPMSNGLVEHISREALKAAPPVAVTAYSLVSKGVPFIISILTLVYLSVQIARTLWTWAGEIERKRATDAARPK